MKRDQRIVSGSMGSFLLPPNHPGLTHEVEQDLNLKIRKENRGSMSLEYAAFECQYIHPEVKMEATKLIETWKENKLPLDNQDVQKWISACVNHMGNEGAKKYITKYYPEYKGITI